MGPRNLSPANLVVDENCVEPSPRKHRKIGSTDNRDIGSSEQYGRENRGQAAICLASDDPMIRCPDLPMTRFLIGLTASATPPLPERRQEQMFEPDLNQRSSDSASSNVTRRGFLISAATIAAGVYTWCSMNKPHPSAMKAPAQKPGDVTVVEFSNSGERTRVAHIPNIVKTGLDF